jgi:hypothetical protein
MGQAIDEAIHTPAILGETLVANIGKDIQVDGASQGHAMFR